MGQLSGRSIRTFVLRQGRLTEGQQRSLDLYWGRFGIDVNPGDSIAVKSEPLVIGNARANHSKSGEVSSRSESATDLSGDPGAVIRDDAPDVDRINLDRHFEVSAPVWMEIGIGNGAALTYMAARNPSVNFLGVEVHLPGVGHALGEIANAELSNVRVIRYDVVDLIEHYMMPVSVDRVLIYFPDPWHKTRHHKRRLVNPKFLTMLATMLRPAGMIHFASDWVPYAEQVRSIVTEHPQFEVVPDDESARSITQLRPETHFERRGLKLGHKVTDLVIRKR